YQPAPTLGRKAQRLGRTLSENGIAADLERTLKMDAHEALQGGRLQPATGRLRDVVINAVARDAHAKKLGLAFFKGFGLGDFADFIIRQLLEPPVTLVFGKREVFSYLLEPGCDVAQNRLTATDSPLENADPHQATTVDVEVDGAGRDKIVDRHRLADLPITIDAAD